MKDPQTAALFDSRRRMRSRSVITVGRSLRGILEVLRRNEIVCVAGDVDFMPKIDMVNIFGAPARMPMGPARLCVKTGAPIVPGFVHQRPRGRYLFRIHPPIVPGPGAAPEALEERIVEIMQKEILEDPTQWFAFVDYWNLEASLALARETVES